MLSTTAGPSINARAPRSRMRLRSTISAPKCSVIHSPRRNALAWSFAKEWDVAAAVEASSGRELRSEVDGLMRLSYRMEAP